MKDRLWLRGWLLVLALTPLLAVLGCGGGGGLARGNVSGKVTIKGKAPKSKLYLSIVGVDNVPMNVLTDEAGQFALGGVPVGEVKVAVLQAPDGANEKNPVGKSVAGSPARPRRPAAVQSEIPPEFMDPAKPRLKYTIKEGDNPLEINLVPGK